MRTLHSEKIATEKNAFLSELYTKLPKLDDLTRGDLASKARRVHERFLPLHIVKHYTSDTKEFRSPYFGVLMSHLIESECLLILGFRTSGVGILRAALEAALKFLYYETHPIEARLHAAGTHDLSNTSFREFAYIVPGLNSLSFMSRDELEKLWTDLCQFVHSDLKAISVMSVVADISTVLNEPEKVFVNTLQLIQGVIKVALAICLTVDPAWLQNVEKVYFDAILEAFTNEERKNIKDALRIT